MLRKVFIIMKNFFIEFKKFAFKGNMLDLAVGMIIGTAFTGLCKFHCKKFNHAYNQYFYWWY